MPCKLCELGICRIPSHRTTSPRRPVTCLPSAANYRQVRHDAMFEYRRLASQDIIWQRRTEKYQFTGEGVFIGSYRRGNGKKVLVRGNSVAEVRWEKEEGERYWQKVSYQAPS